MAGDETKPAERTVLRGELRGVLPPGTRLRSYEVISVLGQGGFGITYQARDTQLDRDIAIKEYLPMTLAVREDGTMVVPRSTELVGEFVWGRDRFLDEARTLAKLGHAPSIVRVHDFLEANGTAYMVMALAEGETLDRRLKRERVLPSPAIERMLYSLLDGLEQVHAIGFLHRDIKPANIIVDASNNPTLIDFGASRAAMAGRSTAMTAVFTPGYAAAEQFTSAKQGPWTDIYGLSATLYCAITGNVPPSAFDRMLDDAYEPLGQLLPAGFSPSLLTGIDAGLAVRASDRPQSIAEWRQILSQAAGLGDLATQVLPKSKPPLTPPGRRLPRRKRQVLWAGVAVALILAGGGYLLFASTRPISPGAAVQGLTAEELEQALAERRKADAAAAEKKRLEEEAQRQADADAKAKQAADAELAQAQQQRQKAEEELAKLKADMEARRQTEAAQREQAAAAARRALEEAAQRNKAETEMAALRQAEKDAKQKAAADAAAKQAVDEAAQRKIEAETAALRQAEEDAQRKAAADAVAKQKADEALAKAQAERQRADKEAARQKAELEAKQKVDAEASAQAEADAIAKTEAAAKQKAETEAKAKADADAAAEKKAAETAENGLRLATTDRQRLQVALTSIGFDTGGNDGVFGPRSREMIAGWQKARNQPATGFLSAPEQQALLREAAAAVRKYDDEQKLIEEEKKKASDEAKKKVDEEATKLRAAQPSPEQIEPDRAREKAQTDAALNGLMKLPSTPTVPTPSTGAAGPPAPPSRAAATASPSPPTQAFDGIWTSQSNRCIPKGFYRFTGITVRASRFQVHFGASTECSVEVKPDGSFENRICSTPLWGKISGNKMDLSLNAPGLACEILFVRQ
jgi:serine/threonine protein kinase/peptidoglycan hydrolase-like protein with peptidoglycan-binding domain